LYNTPFLSGVLEEKIMEVIKIGRIKPESYKAPEFFRYKCRHCDAELLADGRTDALWRSVNHCTNILEYYILKCPICGYIGSYRNFEITKMRIGSTAIDSLFGGLCDNCPDEKKECAKCSFF
jgi:hypothetical protein